MYIVDHAVVLGGARGVSRAIEALDFAGFRGLPLRFWSCAQQYLHVRGGFCHESFVAAGEEQPSTDTEAMAVQRPIDDAERGWRVDLLVEDRALMAST